MFLKKVTKYKIREGGRVSWEYGLDCPGLSGSKLEGGDKEWFLKSVERSCHGWSH